MYNYLSSYCTGVFSLPTAFSAKWQVSGFEVSQELRGSNPLKTSRNPYWAPSCSTGSSVIKVIQNYFLKTKHEDQNMACPNQGLQSHCLPLEFPGLEV